LGGYARAATSGIDVARAFRPAGRTIGPLANLRSDHQRDDWERERHCEQYHQTDSRFHVYPFLFNQIIPVGSLP
jgi:hypothetical protein